MRTPAHLLLQAGLLLPWAATVAAHPRLRRDLAARLGLTVAPVDPGAIWVHAASVGELGAAEALVRRLAGPVLLTSDTDTGLEVAKQVARRHPHVVAWACPADQAITLAPLWAQARPRGVVFVEGTFWPTLAELAHRAGVPVLRVSAKMGRRTRQLPPRLRRWLWRHTTAVAPRDEEEGRAFAALGFALGPVADLKTDRPRPPSPLTWRRPFVVGASTRPGDERALLEAMVVCPGHQLLLAPRHPERLGEVARLLEGRPWVRRSELAHEEVPEQAQVLLLDSLGELSRLMDGASAVFVGGTFSEAIGGHSPREAWARGLPVVCGPAQHSDPAAFAACAPEVVTRAGLGEGLRRAIARGPARPPESRAGERTARFVEARLGAMAPERSPRPWLWPVGQVVTGVAEARRISYSLGLRRVHRVGVPVISVGSTNARSPGRTSTVAWLVGRLRARGHTVGVALRGYRRAARGAGLRRSWETPGVASLGDEGELLRRAGALVAAGPDRVEGARALVGRGATVVVLDDGLQHQRLHRDVELVLVDGRWPDARGPLPAGERREWRSRPHRADLVWDHQAPGFRREMGPWMRGERQAEPPRGPVVAFCGVGHPASVLRTLVEEVEVHELVVLGDHRRPDEQRLVAQAQGRPLVCTAKDWVRLSSGLRARVWWRDVRLVVPQAQEEALWRLISLRAAAPSTCSPAPC